MMTAGRLIVYCARGKSRYNCCNLSRLNILKTEGGHNHHILSDRSGGLPRLSLLRTVLATFTAYGSSTLKVTRLPGNTISGSHTLGISTLVVLVPLCTVWVSFTIDKDVSFDMSIRGML